MERIIFLAVAILVKSLFAANTPMLNGLTALRPARVARIKCGSRAPMKFTKNIGPHWPAALIFLIPKKSLSVVMKPGRHDTMTCEVAALKEARGVRYVNCCRKISTILADPNCGIEDVDKLTEELCRLSPDAFCEA